MRVAGLLLLLLLLVHAFQGPHLDWVLPLNA